MEQRRMFSAEYKREAVAMLEVVAEECSQADTLMTLEQLTDRA